MWFLIGADFDAICDDLTEISLIRSFKRFAEFALKTVSRVPVNSLLSHNFSEQRKLRIYNGFSQFRDKIVVKNFGSKQVNAYPIEDFSYRM